MTHYIVRFPTKLTSCGLETATVGLTYSPRIELVDCPDCLANLG